MMRRASVLGTSFLWVPGTLEVPQTVSWGQSCSISRSISSTFSSVTGLPFVISGTLSAAAVVPLMTTPARMPARILAAVFLLNIFRSSL